MTVKLLTEQHLEFLSFEGGCTGSSESTLVEMSNCWKSHATAHFIVTELSDLLKSLKCLALTLLFAVVYRSINLYFSSCFHHVGVANYF